MQLFFSIFWLKWRTASTYEMVPGLACRNEVSLLTQMEDCINIWDGSRPCMQEWSFSSDSNGGLHRHTRWLQALHAGMKFLLWQTANIFEICLRLHNISCLWQAAAQILRNVACSYVMVDGCAFLCAGLSALGYSYYTEELNHGICQMANLDWYLLEKTEGTLQKDRGNHEVMEAV